MIVVKNQSLGRKENRGWNIKINQTSASYFLKIRAQNFKTRRMDERRYSKRG
jgi:hypothetical protein